MKVVDEHVGTQSLPGPTSREGNNDVMPPNHIVFLKESIPKKKRQDIAGGKIPSPQYRIFGKLGQKFNRNDEHAGEPVNSLSAQPDRGSCGNVTAHLPREIILVPPKEEKKDPKRKFNRFGYPRRPRGDGRQVVESRNDEVASPSSRSLLPPLTPLAKRAFSFEAGSPISSAESNLPGSKHVAVPRGVETPNSHDATPVLRNTLPEDRDPIVPAESESQVSTNGSTVSSRTPLRLDSYVSIEYQPKTPMSVPFDERTNDDLSQQITEDSSDSSLLVSDPGKQPLVETRNSVQAPLLPASKNSYSMRSTSILDREERFTVPLVDQAQSEEVEQRAADRAYIGCEIDEVTEMECTRDLIGEKNHLLENNVVKVITPPTTTPGSPIEGKGSNVFEQVTDVVACEDAPQKPTIVHERSSSDDETCNDEEEDWEKAALSKPAVPEVLSTTINVNNEKTVDGNIEKEVELCPSDEAFFGGASHNTAERSSKCSTVALTEESKSDDVKQDENKTPEGGLDDFFDRLTDCVTCWQLEP